MPLLREVKSELLVIPQGSSETLERELLQTRNDDMVNLSDMQKLLLSGEDCFVVVPV